MFLRPRRAKLRRGITRVDAVVAVNLLVLTIGLLIPACHRAQDSATRTQGHSNLKNIALAFHSFHDAHKRLPFNGTKHAARGDNTSGSWAFQILPYIDQEQLFAQPTAIAEVPVYMCPSRARSLVEKGFGAWTDYFINNYLNEPANASKPDNPDVKRTFASISDGTSTTIMIGQGNIATGDYGKAIAITGSHNIFIGGGPGTMRAGPNWVKGSVPSVTVERDSSSPPDLTHGGWGGPFTQGALMAMSDATIRIFPYSTNLATFGAFLTPTGGEAFALPDS